MTLHELKTIQPYFDAVVAGDKTFEIRNNDRDFHTGDVILLREWDGTAYTGQEWGATITYVTDFAQQPGYVVLGFQPEPGPLKEISAVCDQCGGQWFWPIDNGYELHLSSCHEHSDPPRPLEELLLATLVDGSLPGRDVRLGFNDGEWHIAQEYCGLDESWPTGVVGSGESIRAAIADATQAKGGK